MDEVVGICVSRVFGRLAFIACACRNNNAFSRDIVSYSHVGLVLTALKDEVTSLFKSMLNTVTVIFIKPLKGMV